MQKPCRKSVMETYLADVIIGCVGSGFIPSSDHAGGRMTFGEDNRPFKPSDMSWFASLCHSAGQKAAVVS
jgi:hypothetical protein